MSILLVARDILVLLGIIAAIILYFFYPHYIIATICLVASVILSIITKEGGKT